MSSTQISRQRLIGLPNRYIRVVKCAVLRHGRSWVLAPAQATGLSLGSAPSMLVDVSDGCQVCGSKWLSCHAVYMLIQCTPLLVEKAGVTPDVTFGITTCKQERVQTRDPLQIWNLWGMIHNVQNRINLWLHKLGLGPTKTLKKRRLIGFIHLCLSFLYGKTLFQQAIPSLSTIYL